ncbi:cytochrome c oxidase subunit 4 isoform 1, mitochondrial [Orussus abietinus]|uniref:cytochrome c oxidase subunit 4 isoform 1, mitochondrial n=1 Tax=Orussus abietinus TaxID=222816 RepID=UPI000625C71C|nr:cytochrome c oxidase subunit 4 isoform 1, mitochondrial [Orussus abietinus]XP_023288176.1 cytochrome c oxidase subunit 4 isoform 1, mitochondrial [Orussus abietinus]
MASKLLRSCIVQCQKMQKAQMADQALAKIGSREWVGFGFNGVPNYVDRVDFPMPAIRFKEDTPDIKVLKEKEKGDWKKLTVDEKKALYRASFCQTFAEMEAPTGEWKSISGVSLILVSVGVWLYLFMKWAVYPELPESFSEERRRAQLDRMRKLDVNPITGLNARK